MKTAMKAKTKQKLSLAERNRLVAERAKGRKIEIKYKYADDRIYTDRPKPLPPERILVDKKTFRKDLRRLVVQHLRVNKIKKRDFTLALCQLQDQCTLFDEIMLERIKLRLAL